MPLLQPSIKFSPIIAGTMKWGQWGSRFSTEDYLRMIHQCLDMGVITFDHADIYGHYTTEEEFGNALARIPNLRPQLQLITKCGIRMLSPNRPAHHIKSYDTSTAYIISAAEQSLKNLHTDYLDVLLIHRPDPLMDPEEIAAAFQQLKAAGKVLHFGISNFTASQAALIRKASPLVTHQLEISILHLDPFLNGQLDDCQMNGIQPTAWGPLGSGRLFNPEESDERNQRILAVAQLLGEKYQLQPEQILLCWLLTHPSGITPVLGTSRPERLREAMAARSVKLTREEWFMLWRASTGHEVP